MIVFIDFEQKTTFILIKRYDKDFSDALMLSEDTKILQFNQYQKPDKMYFYKDLESLIKKKNESSIIKVGEHIPSGFSISDGMKIRVTFK